MPRGLKCELHMLLRMGVTVAALTMMSASLRGQGSAVGQTKVDGPLGAYDAALDGAAEAMLSSAVPAPVALNPGNDKVADGELAAGAGLRVFRGRGGGLGSAAARVELLRPIIEPILAGHGVPREMAAAVIMVESGGRSDALSSKGARGLWQLMPDTARRYGLRVDEAVDERLQLFKATTAGAQYLHDLYARFGAWRLALAGYNAGEANVSSAILKAHTQDFDRLSDLGMLPVETRGYVPNVLGSVSFLADTKKDRRPAGRTVFALSGQ